MPPRTIGRATSVRRLMVDASGGINSSSLSLTRTIDRMNSTTKNSGQPPAVSKAHAPGLGLTSTVPMPRPLAAAHGRKKEIRTIAPPSAVNASVASSAFGSAAMEAIEALILSTEVTGTSGAVAGAAGPAD